MTSQRSAVSGPSSATPDLDPTLFQVPSDVDDDLPVSPAVDTLPLGRLGYRDAERLFLCLLDDQADLTYAKSYGAPGQDQAGIDVYGRFRAQQDGEPVETTIPASDRYITLQSKRVTKFTAGDIEAAVTRFLEGRWASTSRTFILATTFDFTDTKLDDAVRAASDRLEDHGVEFVPWHAETINELLRDRPRLVDRFFGEQWVARFCGQSALSQLPSRRLDRTETRRLRAELRTLYESAFAAAASLTPVESAQRDEFVIVDVIERDTSREDLVDRTTREAPPAAPEAATPETGRVELRTTPSRRRPRKSLRSVRALLEDHRGSGGVSGAEPADRWLSRGSRDLLVGDPGTGKSSLLRFVASDLLAEAPESAALQRIHGERLPVWLPFGFLCRHLDADQSHSLTTAVETWLSNHGRPDLVPLVTQALQDDRLLLLIDGIDEWTSESTANLAIGAIETHLGHSETAAVLSTRPYAPSRLPFTLPWRRADVAPLDREQQRRIATQYLAPPADLDTSQRLSPGDPTTREGVGPHQLTWSAANVEPFLAELGREADLQPFARVPLLLALLARTWRGEPLPPRRYDLYETVIRMLLDTHPKMRARASKVPGSRLSTDDFRTLIQAVAHELKTSETPQPVPIRDMRNLVARLLADEDILGYAESEAAQLSKQIMAMAEDEFGVLVAQGVKHVSFVHRVIGDHLVGCHLAEKGPDELEATVVTRHADPAWTDVLLSALNRQTSKQSVAHIIETVVQSGADACELPWPANLQGRRASWLFVADALASEVRLAPRDARAMLERIIIEVEDLTSLEFSAELITRLVRAATSPSHWRVLEPTFRRWLDATRPYAGPALCALHQIQTDDDDRLRRILLQNFRNEDANARSNAVESFVRRFGNRRSSPDSPTESTATVDAHSAVPIDPAVVQMVRDAPDARTQAAALTALALGWPDDPITREHLEWARNTPKTNIRTSALHAIAESAPEVSLADLFTADEYGFVMSHLYEASHYLEDHGWTGLNAQLVLRAVSELGAPQRDEMVRFVEETLRQDPMTGGSRSMCWEIACGPFANESRLRDWVVAELSDNTSSHPLILYNIETMPAAWTDEPVVKAAINSRIGDLMTSMRAHASILTKALADEGAKRALLDALDGFRPYGAARELVRRFGTDSEVHAELNRRFGDDTQAAKLADIALRHLGTADGFARILEVLRNLNTARPEFASEEHVVVAGAVATAWHLLEEAAAGRASEDVSISPDEAAAILASHDSARVAADCMTVPTRRGLSWHIDNIIYSWPAHTALYAINELHNDAHVSEGLPDRIHSAVLYAHSKLQDEASAQALDLALDLLTALRPELREVLVHELCLAPIPAAQLLEVLSAWTRDQDDGVRRTAAVGITRALQRTEHDPAAAGLLTQWQETVRHDLVAYGPSHDEQRQIAWICMLLLEMPELLDGLLETIGEASPPGVRLTDLYGNPDDLLVDLVARQWDTLASHLGDDPLRRLSNSRSTKDTDDARALSALLSASDNRLIVDFVEERAAQSGASAKDQISAVKSTSAGLELLLAETGRTQANFRRVLEAADRDIDAPSDRGAHRERWAFTKLTADWDFSDEAREALLIEASDAANGHPQQYYGRGSPGSIIRAAHAFLYPESELVQSRLARFTAWLRRPFEDGRESSTTSWLEAITMLAMATPVSQFPSVVEGLSYPYRVERASEPSWKFTIPLLRRTATDPEAVGALGAALDGSTPSDLTPPLPVDAPYGGPDEHYAARRIYGCASVLKAAGVLTPERRERALSVLRQVDRRITVCDLFSEETGPVHTFGDSL